MTQTRPSYTVMGATGHIGKVVTELLLQIGNQVRRIGLLALSLTAALAFLLGCARAAEKEAGTQASDTTTIEARVAARDSAPSPSTKPPAFPPPFHTESATRFPKIIGWPEGKMPAAPTGFQVSVYAGGLNHPRWLYVLPNGDVLVADWISQRARA